MYEKFLQLVHDYGPYVEEVRRRLFFSILFFVALFCFGFMFSPTLIGWFIYFFSAPGVSYIVTSPFQALSLSMDMGFTVALTFFLPLLLVEIYDFIAPALTRREKVAVAAYSSASLVLFLIGFAYGLAILYYTMLTITHLNTAIGLTNLWDITSSFSQFLLTSVLLGFLFQFPLILHALIQTGVLTKEFLATQRRVVIAASVVIVALLPPTDGLSLIIMAVPLIGLFELVLLLNKASGKGSPGLSELYS